MTAAAFAFAARALLQLWLGAWQLVLGLFGLSDVFAVPKGDDLGVSTGLNPAAANRERWRGRKEFYAKHFGRMRPVVLTGAMAGWRCMDRWTPAFFRSREGGGDTAVTVSFTNEERVATRKREMRLADYIDRVHAASSGNKNPQEYDNGGDSGNDDDDDDDNNNNEAAAPYLKQCALRTTFPHLAEDVHPEKLFRSEALFASTYLWIGPRGAVTGLHSDDEHNLLLQVYGRKRVFLVPPGERCRLRPNKKYDSGTECCDLDLDIVKQQQEQQQQEQAEPPHGQRLSSSSKSDRQQRLLELEQVSGVLVADLRAGDTLYIPRGWFHQVVTQAFSISVNHFASDGVDFLRFGVVRELRDVVHRAWVSVFGPTPGACVCH